MRKSLLFSAVLLAVVQFGTPDIGHAAGASKTADPSEEVNTVDIGAFTFSVEAPGYTQYIVAKVHFKVSDDKKREEYRTPRHIVWFRDMVLGVVKDTEADYITSEVDIDALKADLEERVVSNAPYVDEVKVALLGRRNVPRR